MGMGEREVSETPIVRDGSSAEQEPRTDGRRRKKNIYWGLVAGDEARRGRVYGLSGCAKGESGMI